jgi:hypothetical protein
MQTLRVSFQDMTPSEIVRKALEDRIADRVAGLQQKFGRIVSCRVTIKGPGDHHRQGGPYEVKLHVSLPGDREVHVDRTPDADTRHGDLNFAVGDAFKRAERQLEDQVHLMQDAAKAHHRDKT